MKADVSSAQVHQTFPRVVEQRLDALDRIHLVGQPRQDRGLISASRADFQDLVFRLDVEPLGHQRDDVRLADRLAEPDRGGAVGVGFFPQGPREKPAAAARVSAFSRRPAFAYA